MRHRPLSTIALCATLTALFAGGCVTRARPSYVTYARVAPPAPLVEVTGTMPGSDAVWVNGYWYWNGADYVWVRGHWATRPDENYVWVRSGWVLEDREYRFVPGRWVRRGNAPRVRYVHPAPPVIRRGPTYRTMARARAADRSVRVESSGGARVRPR